MTADRPRDPRGRNPAAQHPPLYYLLLAPLWLVVTWPVLGLAHDQAVTALRMLSSLLVVPVPAVVLVTAKNLGLPERGSLTSSLLVLGIPQFAHIAGLVNNDALLVLTCSLALLFASKILGGDRRPKTAVIFGVVVGASILVKAFALVFLAVIGLVYYLAARTPGNALTQRPMGVAQLGLVTLGTATVVGGWWWALNIVRYGTLQPRLLARPAGLEASGDLRQWIGAFGERFVDGFWGGFGTLDTFLPRVVTVGAWSILLFLLVVGLFRAAEVGVSRRQFAVRLVPAVAVGVGLISMSLLTFLESGWAAGMQGRYAFLGLVGLSVGAGVGLTASHLLERCQRRLVPGAVLVGSLVLHTFSFFLMLHSWWGPQGEAWTARRAMRSLQAWASWPPVVWYLALAGLLLTSVCLCREILKPDCGGASP